MRAAAHECACVVCIIHVSVIIITVISGSNAGHSGCPLAARAVECVEALLLMRG